MAKKRNRVDVHGSKAHRRAKHHREGTDVLTSDALRISVHDRSPRRTDAEIAAVIKRHKNKSLSKKRELSLRDRRALERRGYL